MKSISNTEMLIQQELLDLLETKPIHKIKIKDITERLKISRTTFYRYYDSTYSCLQTIIDTFYDELVKYPVPSRAAFNAKYFHEPHPKLVKILEFLLENSKLVRTMFGPNGEWIFKKKGIDVVRTYIDAKGKKERSGKSGKYYDFLEEFLIGGHLQITLHYLANHNSISINDFAILWSRLFYGCQNIELPE
ncbi:MAG: TetR/AcrR family transcriptional regulator [Treponema sp.]|nr:TetR/AcrR family transcriptional regulator [Treponema sp.]